MRKKLISLVMAVAMLLSLVPATVFAVSSYNYECNAVVQGNADTSAEPDTHVFYDANTQTIKYKVDTTKIATETSKDIYWHGASLTNVEVNVYRLSAETGDPAPENWEAVQVATSGDGNVMLEPSSEHWFNTTEPLTPGTYMLTFSAQKYGVGSDESYIWAHKYFRVNDPNGEQYATGGFGRQPFATLSNYVSITDSENSSHYAKWTKISRKANGTDTNLYYQPSAVLSDLSGSEAGSTSFGVGGNSRTFQLNLKGYVFGGNMNVATSTTWFQDQAEYETDGWEGGVSNAAMAYRNVYYDIASMSDIHVYMREVSNGTTVGSGMDENYGWVEVKSTVDNQVASGSNAQASLSNITWKLNDGEDNWAAGATKDTTKETVSLAVTFPAGAAVSSYEMKVEVDATVHATDWHWGLCYLDGSHEDDWGDARNDALKSVTQKINNYLVGNNPFNHVGNEYAITYKADGTSEANDLTATLVCATPVNRTVVASTTNVMVSNKVTMSVNPSRVWVSDSSYEGYADPKPVNEQLDLRYLGNNSKLINFAGIRTGDTKEMTNQIIKDSGENWYWYPADANYQAEFEREFGDYKDLVAEVVTATGKAQNVLVLDNFWMEYNGRTNSSNPWDAFVSAPVILPANTVIVLTDGSINNVLLASETNAHHLTPDSTAIYGVGDLAIVSHDRTSSLTVDGLSGIRSEGSLTVNNATVNVSLAEFNGLNAKNGVAVNNAAVTVNAYTKGIVASTSDVTIDKASVVTVTMEGDEEYNGYGFMYGIYAGRDVKVASASDVTVDVSNPDDDGNYNAVGIYTVNGNVTVDSSKVDVSVVSDDAYGIYTENHTGTEVSFKDADVDVVASGTNFACGIYAGTNDISGDTDLDVTVVGGNEDESYGIWANCVTGEGTADVNVKVTSDYNDGDSYGIQTWEYVDLKANSLNVEVNHGSAIHSEYNGDSFAAYVKLDVATLTATATNFGIYAEGGVTATATNATVTTSGTGSVGVYAATGNVELYDGDWTVDALEDAIKSELGNITADVESLDLYSTGITVSALRGSVDLAVEDESFIKSLYSDAINANENGDTVTTAGDFVLSCGPVSYGIIAIGDITMLDGSVEVDTTCAMGVKSEKGKVLASNCNVIVASATNVGIYAHDNVELNNCTSVVAKTALKDEFNKTRIEPQTCGIQSETGSVLATNSDVTAEGTSAGIKAMGDVIIDNAGTTKEVNATGNHYGIVASGQSDHAGGWNGGNVVINGNVNAVANNYTRVRTPGSTSHPTDGVAGIAAGHDVVVNGGNVTAKSDLKVYSSNVDGTYESVNEWTYGIYANHDVQLNGGNVNAEAYASCTDSTGDPRNELAAIAIYAGNDVKTAAGAPGAASVTASATSLSNNCAGICAVASITDLVVTGAMKVTVPMSDKSQGIYAANGSVGMTTGSLDVTGGKYGVSAKYNVTMTDKGPASQIKSVDTAVYSDRGSVTMNLNTLTAEATRNAIYADYFVKASATSLTASSTNTAIYADGGNATITADKLDVDSAEGWGIYAGISVYVTSDDMDVKAGEEAIVAECNFVEITGKTANAKATVTSQTEDAIKANNANKVTECGNVAITNFDTFTVIAVEEDAIDAEGTSTDLEKSGTVKITNVKNLNLTAGSSDIEADGDVKVEVTNMNAVATETSIRSLGGKVDVKAADATVTSLTGSGVEAAAKSVTMEVTGTANVTADDYGIKAKTGVEATFTNLTVNTTEDEGIYSETGNVTVNVTNKMTAITADEAIDAEGGNVVLNASETNLTSRDADAIYAKGDITVNVDDLTITASQSDLNAVDGNVYVEVDKATLTAKNGNGIKTEDTENEGRNGNVFATATTLMTIKAEKDAAINFQSPHCDMTTYGNITLVSAENYTDVFAKEMTVNKGTVTAAEIKADTVNVNEGGKVVGKVNGGDVNMVGDDTAITGDVKAADATLTDVTGNVTATGDVVVNGDVVGNVNADGKVTVNSGASVGSTSTPTDLTAETVEVSGKVNGDVTAAEGDVTVNSGAAITGDVTANNLTVMTTTKDNATVGNKVDAIVKVTGELKVEGVGGANNRKTSESSYAAVVYAKELVASKTTLAGNSHIYANVATFTNGIQGNSHYISGLKNQKGTSPMGMSNTAIVLTAPDNKTFSMVPYYAGGFGGGGGGAVATTVTTSLPLLKMGSKEADAIKTLQTKLNSLGYNVVVDGVFGSQTYNAVVAFQKAHGLTVDGVVGSQTWGALGVSGVTTYVTTAPSAATSAVTATISSNMPLVKLGSRGDAVKALQTKLNALGYDCGTVDGVFGQKTLAAVKAYQTARGLTVDGVVGNQTWGTLL